MDGSFTPEIISLLRKTGSDRLDGTGWIGRLAIGSAARID